MVPYKSARYLVGYKWRRGKWKCTNLVQDKILEATNNTREIVPFWYLKENEAIFMLEMYLSPDSNNKDKVKYIKKGNCEGNLNKSRECSTEQGMEILKLNNTPNHEILPIWHDTKREIMQKYHSTYHKIWTH